MNRMLVILCIFLLTAGFVGCHTYAVRRLDQDVTQICDQIEASYDQGDWDRVSAGMRSLEERWNKSRFWACLTIDTQQIEELETSLRQSTRYAEIRAREDFIGEFVMFRMLAERLPHQEGFRLTELL